ncbi:MAG: hypothetical protein HY862_02555 [Chloroflexi bacterium]|nr:hypothetical protein [Chloroflexota bacterium]
MRNKTLLMVVIIALTGILVACKKDEDKSDGGSNGNPNTPTLTPTAGLSPVTINPNANGIQQETLESQKLAPGEGRLVLNVSMPEGYKFNNLAPFVGEFSSDSTAASISESDAKLEEIEPKLPIVIPLILQAGEAIVTLNLNIYWCEAVNESLCFVDRRTVTVPLTVAADGITTQAIASVALVPPVVQ